MQITPSTAFEHDDLIIDVVAYLSSKGFRTEDLTYATNLNGTGRLMLSMMRSPTATYARKSPDKLALFRSDEIEVAFYFDAKTHKPGNYHDIMLELLPVCQNIIRHREMGVEVLYCYRDLYASPPIECGFWVEDIPRPDIIFFYKKREDLLNSQKKYADRYFPGIPTYDHPNGNGTGTPSIKISEAEARKLPHWKILIDRIFEDATSMGLI